MHLITLEKMINLKSYRQWLLFIYILIMISNSVFTFFSPGNLWKYDKVIHFLEYFVLGFLLFHVMYEKPFASKDVIYFIAFISLIPIIDECMQFYSELWGPKRIPSLYDALADYAGCYSGCFCYNIKDRILNG